MVNLSDAFLVVVLLFDLVVSIWNAYAAGVTLTLLRRQPGQRFAKVAAGAGLGLAFAGMAYATTIVIAWAALLLGFLAPWDFLFLVSFDLLVFGAMIIGFGLVVTAQSVAIAYRQRRFGDIAIAAWNVFAEVWDITIYAEGFRDAAGVVSSGRNRLNLYAVVAIAVGVAFIVTYVAYRHGVRRAEKAIDASPNQPAPDSRPYDVRVTDRAHPLRTVLVAAAVVVVVVVGLVAASPYVTPHVAQVTVTEFDVYAPQDVCGLNSTPIYYTPGFSDHGGASDAFRFDLPNYNATSCTLRGVTTNTTGFALTDVQVPVTVAAGQTGYLNLTVVLPAGDFNGPLALIYT